MSEFVSLIIQLKCLSFAPQEVWFYLWWTESLRFTALLQTEKQKSLFVSPAVPFLI